MAFTYSVRVFIDLSTDGTETVFPIDLSVAPIQIITPNLSSEFSLVKPKPISVLPPVGFPGATASILGKVVTVVLVSPPAAGFVTLNFWLEYAP
jgi:hypothetical protein